MWVFLPALNGGFFLGLSARDIAMHRVHHLCKEEPSYMLAKMLGEVFSNSGKSLPR